MKGVRDEVTPTKTILLCIEFFNCLKTQYSGIELTAKAKARKNTVKQYEDWTSPDNLVKYITGDDRHVSWHETIEDIEVDKLSRVHGSSTRRSSYPLRQRITSCARSTSGSTSRMSINPTSRLNGREVTPD